MGNHLEIQDFSLAGYQGRTEDGRAQVQRFATAERMRRSGRLLAICWGLGIAGAFIPVAHFLLVPGFAVGGLWAAGRRLRERQRVFEATGTCPDCRTHQTFDLDAGWTLPGTVTCAGCSRALTAVPMGDSGAARAG